MLNETDIVEGNRLIAEFMGFKQVRAKYYGKMTDKDGKRTYPAWRDLSGVFSDKRNDIADYGLQFHFSWDWLMPAYKKFNDMVEANEITHDYESSAWHDALEVYILKVNITEAHKCFSQLIKWYNQNK